MVAESTPDKYYVVFNGPLAGIYNTWLEGTKIVHGTKGAIHKSFKTKDKAVTEFETHRKQPANSYVAKLAKPASFGRTISLGVIKAPPFTAGTAKLEIFIHLLELIQSYQTNPSKFNL